MRDLQKKRDGNALRHRRLKENRIALGLCLRCKTPARPGFQTCLKHSGVGVSSEVTREKTRSRINQNKGLGLCARCQNQAVPNRTLCTKHAAEYKAYAENNKEHIRSYKKSISDRSNKLKRKPESRAVTNANRRRRKREDPQYAMVERLRKRIGRAIRDFATGRKDRTTAQLIGCSVAELMAHLETQFLPGMTWENRRLWHVDHIRPCASFDLADPEQQKLCFHYTNLQLLWAKDNISKHAKVQ